MAKIRHLFSTTPGAIPASLARGQLATNIADQTVYAPSPDGQVKAVSKGVAGVANAGSLLTLHVPVNYHPVAQFAPGYTEAQLGAKFTDDGTTATLQSVPIFVFGATYYTPVLTCPSVASGAYKLVFNNVTRVITMAGFTPPSTGSGGIDYQTGDVTLVIRSDGHIYPWFYLQEPFGFAGIRSQLFRISPYKTFGAVPVSVGFPGAAATSYWGTSP